MKVYIISYHDSHDYNTRIKYLEKFLSSKGYDTTTVISDFNHIDKCKYIISRPNTYSIHVTPYFKNLSIARIRSYVGFAKTCVKFISEKNDVGLVYLLAPPNIIIRDFAKLKQKMKYKYIVEIGDMWPESIPISNNYKKLGAPAFNIWKYIRDESINSADYVITECDLFMQKLRINGLSVPCKRVYFCKDSLYSDNVNFESIEPVRLCYIGSINNIIDIEYIGRLVGQLVKKREVCVEIIGKGENEKILCDTITRAGAKCNFHGAIYDDLKKYSIASKCHFALNIMKVTVFVGMTMKSLDYFSIGLPIINNIVGDTWDVVNQYKCGINGKVPEEVAEIVSTLTVDEFKRYRKAACNIHETLFSISKYEDQMSEILELVLGEKYK